MGRGCTVMSDLRLEEIPFEFQGKTWRLHCNMNVLADVQEAYDGDLGAALDEKRTMKSLLAFLAAMLNDYADEQGWPERFTASSLGRCFRSPKEIPGTAVMQLVIHAITPDATEVPATDDPGN